MSDFNFGGTDEESAEIKKLNAEVVSTRSALLTVLPCASYDALAICDSEYYVCKNNC